jgi:hypothetical protein
VFSREEWERLRLVRQDDSHKKTYVKSPVAYERRNEALPRYSEQGDPRGKTYVESPAVYERPKEVSPRCSEQGDRVRSGDVRQEDDNLQTLALVEKTTKVRFLGIPLVEVTREGRWTDESGIRWSTNEVDKNR